MEKDFEKSKGLLWLVRVLCFITLGVAALANPMDLYNPFAIGLGILFGLLTGWLFRLFLKGFLSLFNGQLKKEQGRQAIRFAVDGGLLFLAPFTVMLALAVFYLNWSMTLPFISAGLMAAGTASSIEIGKLQGKQSVKNSIAASLVSFAFSYFFILAIPYLKRAPSLIEGGVQLVRSLMGGGGL
ncbi:MAG: hypothetical protein EOM08_05425 [Clostridia bacterium]|nr:hypothetical protein [Clostridia bacterium]NCC75857.1 hypothetical protein [Clostridia bacterium]